MGRYSIKPGRGPSAFGAFGGIVGAIFGVLWTVFAIAITADAPWPIVRIIFPAAGVLFIVASIGGAIYNARNATRPNRYSVLDVVPTDSEPDPLAPRRSVPGDPNPDRFCTQCGAGLRDTDNFCGRCGARVGA